MNIAKGARTRVQKSPGGSFVDVNLHNIFAATRKGVSCNVILTLKLKCSVKEATKSDGTFYRWDERSPAVPGRDTIWTVAGTAVGMFVTDIELDIQSPQRASEELIAKLDLWDLMTLPMSSGVIMIPDSSLMALAFAFLEGSNWA